MFPRLSKMLKVDKVTLKTSVMMGRLNTRVGTISRSLMTRISRLQDAWSEPRAATWRRSFKSAAVVCLSHKRLSNSGLEGKAVDLRRDQSRKSLKSRCTCVSALDSIRNTQLPAARSSSFFWTFMRNTKSIARGSDATLTQSTLEVYCR